MRFFHTPLLDAQLIQLDIKQDSRGFFTRSWCRKEFENAGIQFEAVQANFSVSKKKGTLRGLHFQRFPFAEPKIVRCLHGSVQEVIADMRPDSPTYLQHFKTILSGSGQSMIYVPPGFAQGIQTLEDDTIVEYIMGEYYHPECYDGLRHDDPALDIQWPLPISAISDQDLQWPLWNCRAEQNGDVAAKSDAVASVKKPAEIKKPVEILYPNFGKNAPALQDDESFLPPFPFLKRYPDDGDRLGRAG